MANILRRPMFRGGTPKVYGTGITSNLETRQKYAESDPEGVVDRSKIQVPGQERIDPMEREAFAKAYGENIRKQMMPSQKEQIYDFLRAFGASATPPNQPQTWGSALGRTGVNVEAITGPKIAAARKAGTEGYLQALKGVDDKKLFVYQQQAKDLYETGQFKSYGDALAFVLQKEFAGKDNSDSTINSIATKYMSEYSVPYEDAYTLAKTEYQRTRDKNEYLRTGGGNFAGLIDKTKFEREDDGFKLMPNKVEPAPNSTFIDKEGNVYIYANKRLTPYYVKKQ